MPHVKGCSGNQCSCGYAAHNTSSNKHFCHCDISKQKDCVVFEKWNVEADQRVIQLEMALRRIIGTNHLAYTLNNEPCVHKIAREALEI